MAAVPAFVRYEVDVRRPNAARIHDFYLGGAHNYAADRAFAKQAVRIDPELPVVSRAHRVFLRQAVRHCWAAGVRQFLDIGSGIPTCGATHQTLPDARVVYVDSDPVTVAFARGLLRGEPRTCAVEADLRRPDQVLRHPGVLSHLDLREPYAVLMVDVLRYIDDATGPGRVVRRYRHALPAGGFLVVSHPTPVEQLMEGLSIEAPCVVPGAYAGIGRKPQAIRI